MTDTVERSRIARMVMSSRFPIGVATTYKQPIVGFCCVILLSIYLVVTITGCQSTSSTRPPRGGNESPVYNDRNDPIGSVSQASLPEEFIRRLDLAHKPHFRVSPQNIRNYFEDWPSQQRGGFDRDPSNYVHTLSELVLNALHEPLRAITHVNNLRTEDQSQRRAKVVMLSYIYRWLDDCENSVRMLVSHEPRTEAESSEWSERIWSVFDGPCVYRSLTERITNNLTVQGWWDLAAIAVVSNSLHERAVQYRRWKVQYAQHLAARFPPAFFRTQHEVPKKIALLLPQSGPLSSAATAIKNGFFSAHLDTSVHHNLSIDVYDTTTTEITTLIAQVIEDGVDVIVGPLEKDNVRRILEKSAVSVPIVALNQPTSGSRLAPQNNLVQLAQVVEDDAIALASQINTQNLRRVLLVLGKDYWCVRAAIGFRNTLDDSVVVAAETVLSDLSRSTENVARLLNVTESTTRQTDIARVTRRTIEFTARRRHDVDAIVAFVDEDEFSALSAALHYHFAGDIPVLLAEPTFRNVSRTGNYADGATFTTTPAQLYSIPLTTQIRESFADASVLYPLYVFGIDTYRTALHIEEVLKGGSVYGYTGYLRQDDNKTLVREPIWGTVEGRILKPRKHIKLREGLNRQLF